VPAKEIAAVTDDYCTSASPVNLAHLFYQARRWTLYRTQPLALILFLCI
jgi:hypothetical protein